MAHFINAKGTRISNSIQPAGVGVPITIGVWGAAGLTIGPNDRSLASIKPLGPDKQNNSWYSLTGARTGHVMVEAKMGDAVWDSFQLAVQATPPTTGAGPAPNPDGRYTTDPHEIKTQATKTTPAALMTLLAMLSELNESGKRNLIAQHMHETGGGKSCYNWNLGNQRTTHADVPHMYLRNVAEYLTPAMAKAALAAGEADGTARPPSTEEAKRWPPKKGLVVVMFNPPSEGARFRAFASIAEGGQGLLGKYRRVHANNSDFFPALNRDDFETIAQILFAARYYTGSAAIYATRMREWRATINRQLGS